MAPARRLLVLPLLLLLTAAAAPSPSAAAEEEFTEELLLRPLPDRKALAHFHFRSSTPAPGRHHHLFPKAISHLVRTPPQASNAHLRPPLLGFLFIIALRCVALPYVNLIVRLNNGRDTQINQAI
jgi:hypothetical protein